MTVTLNDALRAAAARRACITVDTAGYVVLHAIDALGGPAPRRGPTAAARTSEKEDSRTEPSALGPPDFVLTEDGSVAVGAACSVGPERCARDLRALLEALLEHARGAGPTLGQVARGAGGDLAELAAEIEAALIPVNRSAGRRAIARLWRETSRAKERGQLAERASQGKDAKKESTVALPPPLPQELGATRDSSPAGPSDAHEHFDRPAPWPQVSADVARELPAVMTTASPALTERASAPHPLEGGKERVEPEAGEGRVEPAESAPAPLPLPPSPSRRDRTLPLPDFAPKPEPPRDTVTEQVPLPGPFPRLELCDATPLLGSVLDVAVQPGRRVDGPSNVAERGLSLANHTPPMPSGVDLEAAGGAGISLGPSVVVAPTLSVENRFGYVPPTARMGDPRAPEGLEDLDEGWETATELWVAADHDEPVPSALEAEDAPARAWDAVVKLTEEKPVAEAVSGLGEPASQHGAPAHAEPADAGPVEPYVPRRSDLNELLRGFGGQAPTDRDLSRTLKQLVGLD